MQFVPEQWIASVVAASQADHQHGATKSNEKLRNHATIQKQTNKQTNKQYDNEFYKFIFFSNF